MSKENKMARIKKGIKVKIENTKFFVSPEEARSYAIGVLQSGVTFLEIDEWYEEVDDPEPVSPEPEKKLRGPYKKKPVPESYKSLPGKKFTKKVLEFLKQNCDTKDNEMLAKAIKAKFGFSTTKSGVAWQMSHNSIKRTHPYHIKNNINDDIDDEEELPTLPPENN